MIIRKAHINDIDKLVDLGIEFAERSKYAHCLSINNEKIKDFTGVVIDNPNYISLVLEDNGIIKGIFTAQITQTFFSDDLIAQALVWYVRQQTVEGLKLLFEFEKECTSRKINKILLGYKQSYVNMKSIYRKRGYKVFESFFIKDICQQSLS